MRAGERITCASCGGTIPRGSRLTVHGGRWTHETPADCERAGAGRGWPGAAVRAAARGCVVKLVKPAVKVCPTCKTAWKAEVEACPTCSDALAAVKRVEDLARHLHSLPRRLADRFAGTTHPYDIADAISDALAPEWQEEPLAEWERELLSSSEDDAS